MSLRIAGEDTRTTSDLMAFSNAALSAPQKNSTISSVFANIGESLDHNSVYDQDDWEIQHSGEVVDELIDTVAVSEERRLAY